MNRFLLSIVAFMLVFQACKKDPVKAGASSTFATSGHDTIFPGSYLPAYPSSWWNYTSTFTGDTTHIGTAGSYVLNFYHDSFGSNSAQVYVPYYDGQVLYHYSRLVCVESFHGVYAAQPYFLLDTVSMGQTWTYNDYTGPYYHRKVIKAYDTLAVGSTVYNNVIGVKNYSGGTVSMVYDLTVNYYARNIGLVKKIVYNHTSDTIVDVLELQSYYINH
jgi:hypothetical protein